MNKNIIWGIFAIVFGLLSLARMITRFTYSGKFKSFTTGATCIMGGIFLIYTGVSESKEKEKEKSN